jgi:SAM-dependent methyltransferase
VSAVTDGLRSGAQHPQAAHPRAVHASRVTADFGAEPSGPYDLALREGARELFLHEVGSSRRPDVIPVWRFSAAADAVERELLGRGAGPVLDLGCGPGRMVLASLVAGRPALGVDSSRAAVELATARGLPVLRRSLFEPLPGEGRWGTVLLLDGNIGIGGDPARLLDRAAALARHGGTVIVEGHPDAAEHTSFDAVLVDAHGRRSTPFRWARVGAAALRRHARRAGLRLTHEWRAGERTFCEYTVPMPR